MGDSTDSEEFYDAEEFTPTKGSKRSLSKTTVTPQPSSPEHKPPSQEPAPLSITQQAPSSAVDTETGRSESTPEDDRTTVKNVVQGRRRFRELRRCMQAEGDGPGGEDGLPPGAASDQPFKIISHDTMSLQSMTSLGRIGRILSGAAESHPNIREHASAPPGPGPGPRAGRQRCPLSEELPAPTGPPAARAAEHRNHSAPVLGLCEPDVIASTKANSLKARPTAKAIVTVSGPSGTRGTNEPNSGTSGASGPNSVPKPPRPVAPPRRKKRTKLHGSQSLCTADGDNISVCTQDTDDYYTGDRADSAMDELRLHDEPLSNMALPSPASTIESLTREFQDSLQRSHSIYGSPESCSAAPAKSHPSRLARPTATDSQLDIHDAVRGEWCVLGVEAAVSRGQCRSQAHGHSHGRGESGEGPGAAAGERGPGLGGSLARRSNSNSNSSAVAGGSAGGTRRRSAGDESMATAATGTAGTAGTGRTAGTAGTAGPGAALTDLQILEQVTVLNLDTGERVPLSIAEHKLPQCINPLSLHIMRLTSEYIERSHDDEHIRETDEESESVCALGAEDTKETARDDKTTSIRRKTDKLKRFFGSTVKKTVDAAKSLAQEVSHARHKEDVADIADDVRGEHNIKLKASNSHKGPYDFDGCVRHVQEMSGHMGAVWCCKFSVCGRLLATAGQDRLLRTWVTRDAYHLFQDMRTQYNAEQKSSPTPSQESLPSLPVSSPAAGDPGDPPSPAAPFLPRPFAVYSGHTSDLLDVSWSKNYFLLSSSMDKTVRLWHISRGECLCCFQHIDFVTAIVFHPRDDRYFLSGSLDGKLRLWNIPDKKVAVWNEVDGKTKLITAANFCQNGKFAVVGTYDGRCIFYTTDQLKYHTQIDVRSTRGKNSTGRKISGIEPMPNDDKILVTSNDSRIRLYDLRDLNLSCKYRGYVNVSSQIKASFSHDGKYIVAGSENQCIYIWKTHHDYSKFSSVRRDRNDYWEGIKAHNAVVTCAVFAPNPDHMIRTIEERERESERERERERDRDSGEGERRAHPGPQPGGGLVASCQSGHVLVSADFSGCIKVFVHKAKPKHSSLPASALA